MSLLGDRFLLFPNRESGARLNEGHLEGIGVLRDSLVAIRLLDEFRVEGVVRHENLLLLARHHLLKFRRFTGDHRAFSQAHGIGDGDLARLSQSNPDFLNQQIRIDHHRGIIDYPVNR